MTLSNNLRNFIVDMRDGILEGLFIPKRDVLSLLGAMTNWVEAHSTKFWLTGTVPGAGVLVAPVTLAVYDAANVMNGFDQTSNVLVSITGGGAAGKKIDGVVGPTRYTMVDGQVTIMASATGVGTLILGLSAPSPAGLAVASTATITFS